MDILHHGPDTTDAAGFCCKGINLIRPLPDIAEEALNRIGLYLSMILGANFSSESEPEILVNMSLLLKFGGHMLTKKGIILTFGEYCSLDRK